MLQENINLAIVASDNMEKIIQVKNKLACLPEVCLWPLIAIMVLIRTKRDAFCVTLLAYLWQRDLSD
jgi:hypothetical protein